MSLTHARLLEVLDYDPVSGLFRWRISNSNRAPVGAIAGSRRKGHLAIRIDGVRHYAHRLAWLYMTGEWPKGQIDHKSRDGADNRWVNGRDINLGEYRHIDDAVAARAAAKASYHPFGAAHGSL